MAGSVYFVFPNNPLAQTLMILIRRYRLNVTHVGVLFVKLTILTVDSSQYLVAVVAAGTDEPCASPIRNNM